MISTLCHFTTLFQLPRLYSLEHLNEMGWRRSRRRWRRRSRRRLACSQDFKWGVLVYFMV